MKKLLYTLCFVSVFASSGFTQTLPEKQPSENVPLSEQDSYQQLIGYALEVAGAAFESGKSLGKYKCETIYSTEGYDALADFPCEVIIHSDEGPVAVRYKGIDKATSAKISAFLVENQQTENIRYNNGRFRFSFEKQEEEKKN